MRRKPSAAFRDARVTRRTFLAMGTVAAATATLPATGFGETKFKPIPVQYIAALADPDATAGNNAQAWGLWRRDPGPRGVYLSHFDQLRSAGGVAPARWQFDSADWWLEEHGLIMESPSFRCRPVNTW